MAEGTRSKAVEETQKAQSKINDTLLQFRDETKAEITEMRSQMSTMLSLLQNLSKEKEIAAAQMEKSPPIFPTSTSSSATPKVNHVRLEYETYKSKPQKLSDAFYRARIEESMIGIKAYLDKWNTSPNAVTSEPISLVTDQLQASNDSDSGSETTAENLDDEVLEVNKLPDSEENMGSESAIKHSSIEDDNKLNEMLLPILVGKHERIERNKGNVRNERNVDEEDVVFPLIDLQSVLGSLGDTNDKGSSKGSTKAWFEELTSGLKVVLSQNAIDDVACKVFDEMFQSIRAVLVDEHVIDPYTNGFNFNNLTRFDPGGDRKYALSLSGGVVPPLIGKAQGTCVNVMKGAVSYIRHAFSTIVSGDNHCLIASNHFHIISGGRHAIFALIVDSIAHGDDFTKMDLKALFEEANSELLMKTLSFDPGGFCLLQKGCDSFRINGEQGDYCLFPTTGEEIVARALLKHGLRTYVEIGIRQMSYYVDDFILNYSLVNKAIMGGSEVLCKVAVVGSSYGEFIAAIGGNIIKNGGSVSPCVEAIDETIENSVKLFVGIYDKQGNDQFMSKTKGMVIQLANWHYLIHFMVSCCDAKGLMLVTVAIPYSMHLWGLVDNSAHLDDLYRCTLPRSRCVVLDVAALQKGSISDEVPFEGMKCSHLRTSLKVDQALENQYSVDACRDETTLMMGKHRLATQFDISILLKESKHVGREGYSIYKEALMASRKEKVEVDTMTFMKLALDQAKDALDDIYAVHLYLGSYSTSSCMDLIKEPVVTMPTSSLTRTSMVLPYLGQCKNVFPVTIKGVVCS